MEWHDDPVRVRDAVRRAAWQGAGRLLGVQFVVLLGAAILFPAFAQVKYSGPGMSPRRVAHAIQAAQRAGGVWPTGFETLRPRLRPVPPLGPYRISFLALRTSSQEADYAIGVNGLVETWRIAAEGRVERIGPKPILGTL